MPEAGESKVSHHNARFLGGPKCLEPISKSPEEDNEAGELNEAKEVLWMIFPSDEGQVRELLDIFGWALPFDWPAPGSEDTELGVFMGPEVRHGEAEVYARVQA